MTAGATTMQQHAPYPAELACLVEAVAYKPGWRIWLSNIERDPGCGGLTLVIQRSGPDAYHPDRDLAVNHYFPVPAASYNQRSWRMWLFRRCLDVEQHEAAEFFQIDGHRPYAPVHKPGWDPYLVAELATDEERRTSFRGELNPESP
jgi:hypothetical protein